MGITSFLKRIPGSHSLYRIILRLFRWIFWTPVKRLNVFKTILVNFSLLSFRDACRFPIYIYGKVSIYDLRGRVIIKGPISRGMITFGDNMDMFSASNGSAMLRITGVIVFRGRTRISVNYHWDIAGTLDMGALCLVGADVHLRCWKNIVIGELTRIAVGSQVFDTNFHYTRNVETGEVKRKESLVVIGKYCWIGNRSTVMKGTHLPDYSIVAGNSLLNKDYTKDAPMYPMFAGMPAKMVTSGYTRIYSNSLEWGIDAFFRENPQIQVYHANIGKMDEYSAVVQDFEG